MTPDVNVVLLDFPRPGNEMVCENEDGSFTIMINARLSYENQLKSYQHAMKHIQNNDFQKTDTQMIEAIAHAAKAPEKPEYISSDKFIMQIKRLRKERDRIQRQLQQVEAEAEVRRSMNPWDGWTVPGGSSWFGSGL